MKLKIKLQLLWDCKEENWPIYVDVYVDKWAKLLGGYDNEREVKMVHKC